MSTTRPGLREQRKADTRRTIQEQALALFLDKGFDATTVEEIAAAAGVSHMTFFRYFPTKESVVENDDYDPLLAELIRDRPPEEEPLTAVRRALREGLQRVLAVDHAALLARTKLITTTPALRARAWRNTATTESLFATALADREHRTVHFEHQIIASAITAALVTTLTVWAETDGETALTDLVDAAFDTLAALGGQPPPRR